MPRATMGPGRIPRLEGDDKLIFKRFLLVFLAGEIVFAIGAVVLALLR